MRFYFCRIHLFPRDVNHIRNPADDLESGLVPRQQIIWHENSITQLFLIRFRKIAIGDAGAAHLNLARRRVWVEQFNADAFHRLPDKPFPLICCFALVTDPAAFRRTVERVDAQVELFPEFLRDRTRKRRACRNAEPQLRQHRNVFHFAECLIENRHSGKNCGVAADEIGEDRTRCSVAAHDHRYTACNQRREQIAEPIGMRDRNHAKIQIGIANTHRIANLIAIGQ